MDKEKTTHLTDLELMAWETRKRANLINSIGGFKSVCLIGTNDKTGHTNLAIFNSIVHIGASPPLIGFIIRPDSVDRHTLSNILDTGYYTINHINERIFKQAHQTSARYPKELSEFTATNLITDYKSGFKAPYVLESGIKMGILFKEKIDISLNNTILIIGEIKQVYFPENCLCDDGFLDIEKAQTITCSGLDSYHKTQRISRLTYAKPDKEPMSIPFKYII
jgi:flavin reductase (DIM6/NTAB) family NADH-FMN oxidoreductase RutF